MKKTPENLVKKEIKDYLSLTGWFHYHNLQGLGCYPGIPDLVAIKNGVVLFIEIKGPKGKMRENQWGFHGNICTHGGHCVIARGYEDIERYLKGMGIES